MYCNEEGTVDDQDVLQRIRSLVEEEQKLRDQARPVNPDRLRTLEENLDQCWDLLRQRRAKKEYGEDPDQATARSVSQVEGYLPPPRKGRD